MRARTLNGEKLKVNDSGGNPIEIGAVVVWRVQDTAQAMFDVDDYENYVQMQSESALRHLASRPHTTAVRAAPRSRSAAMSRMSLALGTELEDRLKKAGVVVDEARLTHLAYAPEIAQVMLRRRRLKRVAVHGAVLPADVTVPSILLPFTRPVYSAPAAMNVI